MSVHRSKQSGPTCKSVGPYVAPLLFPSDDLALFEIKLGPIVFQLFSFVPLFLFSCFMSEPFISLLEAFQKKK